VANSISAFSLSFFSKPESPIFKDMPPSKKRSYEEIESVRLESLEEQVSKLIKSNESLRNDVHILTKENSTMRKEMKDLIGRNENFQGRITSLEISRREKCYHSSSTLYC
jgi:regulator of replication initiation timing